MPESSVACFTCRTKGTGETTIVVADARICHEKGHRVFIDFKTYERKLKA